MSIIDKKYAERYRANPAGDWVKQFIDGLVTTFATREVAKKDAEGKDTGEKETVTAKRGTLDLDKVFALAKANHVDTSEMEKQRNQKNAPGRIRMTLGNSIRAFAKAAHGLNDIEGTFHPAPADFLGDVEKTRNADGSAIEKPKPATEAKSDEKAAEPEKTDDEGAKHGGRARRGKHAEGAAA